MILTSRGMSLNIEVTASAPSPFTVCVNGSATVCSAKFLVIVFHTVHDRSMLFPISLSTSGCQKSGWSYVTVQSSLPSSE